MAFQTAEKEKIGSPTDAFSDVYDEMPERLRKQLEATRRHVEEHKEHYPLDRHLPF